MSSMDEIIKESMEHRHTSAYIAANPINNFSDVNNGSYRLQTSHNSTMSNESELSLLSLSLDKELETNANRIDIDELPAFEIRLISPLGRSPSPIDNEDIASPTQFQPSTQRQTSLCQNNPDFVALHDINAQISPPSDHGDDDISCLSRTSSLETIFEGVFLNTPPRQRTSWPNNRHNRSRTNFLEKGAINRLNLGKENKSPLSKSESPPPHQTSIGLDGVTNTCFVVTSTASLVNN